jgi:anti-sigma factor RsiW
MGSLQQLQNNETVLVMYLANELEAEDRAEVEQMLAADGGLRGELAQLQNAQNTVTQLLQNLDKTLPMPGSADTAARRISRIMKQRQVDRLNAQPIIVPGLKRQLAWWVYWVASAAAAVVAVMVWWGMSSDTNLGPSIAMSTGASDEEQQEQQQQAALLEVTMRNVDDNSAPISDAENQAQTLLTRRNEIDKPLSLSILGTSDDPQ